MEKAGRVRYAMCKSKSDIQDAFAHLRRLHVTRRVSKGGSASFQSKRYCDFHLATMQSALDNNELRLLTLYLDDTAIGVEYAYLIKGTLYFFQTGFDPAYQHLSPGHLLIMESIDRAIEDGATQLDFLKGEYDYKKTYGKKTQTTVSMDIWKNPLIAQISRLARATLGLATHTAKP
jgi:CelD/BcsL family acetyltransferase involved in cellulose biosynthesis